MKPYTIFTLSILATTFFVSTASAQTRVVTQTTEKKVVRHYRTNTVRRNVRPNSNVRHYRSGPYIRPGSVRPIIPIPVPVVVPQPTQRVRQVYQPLSRPVYRTEPVYQPAPVYQPERVVVVPRGGYVASDHPQVYRYVRQGNDAVVLVPHVVTDGNTGYIYTDPQPQQAVQPPKVELPDVSCPLYTHMHKSETEVWCTTSRGLRHGPYRSYFRNGQLRMDGSYLYGREEGRWVTYYKSGEVKSAGFFKNGEKSGSWTTYNKNGKSSVTYF